MQAAGIPPLMTAPCELWAGMLVACVQCTLRPCWERSLFACLAGVGDVLGPASTATRSTLCTQAACAPHPRPQLHFP